MSANHSPASGGDVGRETRRITELRWNEAARRRAEREREETGRRLAALREHEERLERLKAQRDAERRHRARLIQARDEERLQAMRERREAYEAERRRVMSARARSATPEARAMPAKCAMQKRHSFRGSTRRELACIENLKMDDRTRSDEQTCVTDGKGMTRDDAGDLDGAGGHASRARVVSRPARDALDGHVSRMFSARSSLAAITQSLRSLNDQRRSDILGRKTTPCSTISASSTPFASPRKTATSAAVTSKTSRPPIVKKSGLPPRPTANAVTKEKLPPPSQGRVARSSMPSSRTLPSSPCSRKSPTQSMTNENTTASAQSSQNTSARSVNKSPLGASIAMDHASGMQETTTTSNMLEMNSTQHESTDAGMHEMEDADGRDTSARSSGKSPSGECAARGDMSAVLETTTGRDANTTDTSRTESMQQDLMDPHAMHKQNSANTSSRDVNGSPRNERRATDDNATMQETIPAIHADPTGDIGTVGDDHDGASERGMQSPQQAETAAGRQSMEKRVGRGTSTRSVDHSPILIDWLAADDASTGLEMPTPVETNNSDMWQTRHAPTETEMHEMEKKMDEQREGHKTSIIANTTMPDMANAFEETKHTADDDAPSAIDDWSQDSVFLSAIDHSGNGGLLRASDDVIQGLNWGETSAHSEHEGCERDEGHETMETCNAEKRETSVASVTRSFDDARSPQAAIFTLGKENRVTTPLTGGPSCMQHFIAGDIVWGDHPPYAMTPMPSTTKSTVMGSTSQMSTASTWRTNSSIASVSSSSTLVASDAPSFAHTPTPPILKSEDHRETLLCNLMEAQLKI